MMLVWPLAAPAVGQPAVGTEPAAATDSSSSPPGPLAAEPAGSAFKVSTSTFGVSGGGNSFLPVVSADGRYALFESSSQALVDPVPVPPSVESLVYRKDLTTGAVQLVSTDAAGGLLSGNYMQIASDATGNRIAFVSDGRVWVKDLSTGEVLAASATLDGFESGPAVSSDGRVLIFTSTSTTTLPEDTDPTSSVYARDLETGELALVSTAAEGSSANGATGAGGVSADGRFVLFGSEATNLHPAGVPGTFYVKDRRTGRLQIASCDAGCSTVFAGYRGDLSDDGRTVAFSSTSAPGSSGVEQGYVKDLRTGALTVATSRRDGQVANAPGMESALSADGRYVAFLSAATNLVPQQTNGVGQAYVKDLRTGSVQVVSVRGGRAALQPAVSVDIARGAGTVVFQAESAAFVLPPYGVVRSDAYAWRRLAGEPAYPIPGGSYVGVPVARVVDTRSGLGAPAPGPVTPAVPLTVPVTGRAGVPSTGVSAVAVNVTVVEPAGDGFLAGYAGGSPRPPTAILNYPRAANRATLALLPVGPDGTVTLYTSQRAHLLVDIQGWFTTPETAQLYAGRYHPRSLLRVLDTTAPGSPVPPLGPGRTVVVDVEDLADLPAATTAVVLNLTAVGPTANGYLSAYPYLGQRPATSVLNFRAGDAAVANRVIVPVAQGRVTLYNHLGTTGVTVDVGGYFTTHQQTSDQQLYGGAWFRPLPAQRMLDTRNGIGAPAGPLGAGATRTIETGFLGSGVPQIYGIPKVLTGSLSGLRAGVATTLVTYDASWPPAGGTDVPVVPGPPVSNAVLSPTRQPDALGNGAETTVRNETGSVDVIWDIDGMFVCGDYCQPGDLPA